MTARTAEAAFEIVAREMFVESRSRRDRHEASAVREDWYRSLTAEDREIWRERATWLAGSLAESDLLVKRMGTG